MTGVLYVRLRVFVFLKRSWFCNARIYSVGTQWSCSSE